MLPPLSLKEAAAYLVLGSAAELRYRAGEEGSSRMVRTLRGDDDGRIVDY
jgi:hypothetical protein